MVAVEARQSVADDGTHRLRAEQQHRMHQLQNFQLGGPEKLTGSDDPRHALQECGDWQIRGTWRMATSCGTQRWLAAFCHSQCPNSERREIDKTQSFFCGTNLDNADPEWRIAEVRALASVASAVHDNTTLEVAGVRINSWLSKRHPSNA